MVSFNISVFDSFNKNYKYYDTIREHRNASWLEQHREPASNWADLITLNLMQLHLMSRDKPHCQRLHLSPSLVKCSV
jgi:hypothetical protein